jgi:hypothetical protein
MLPKRFLTMKRRLRPGGKVYKRLIFRLLSLIAMASGALVVGEIVPPIVQAVAQTADPLINLPTDDLITAAGPSTGQSGSSSGPDHERPGRSDRHY